MTSDGQGHTTRGVRRRTLIRAVVGAGAAVAADAVSPLGPSLVADSSVSASPLRPTGPLPVRPSLRWRTRLEVVAHSLSPGGHISSVDEVIEAQRRGAKVFDLDVRRSFDGLVVYHDAISPIGPVEQRMSQTLKFVLGTPALDAFYDALRPGDSLALDMKRPAPGFGSARNAMLRVVEMLRRNPDRQERTRVWLDDPEDVAEFARFLPDVQVGLSESTYDFGSTNELIDRARRCGADAVSIRYDGLQNERAKELVDSAHQKGLFVYCWDLHDLDGQYRAAVLGVDAITVDDIGLGLRVAESVGTGLN